MNRYLWGHLLPKAHRQSAGLDQRPAAHSASQQSCPQLPVGEPVGLLGQLHDLAESPARRRSSLFCVVACPVTSEVWVDHRDRPVQAARGARPRGELGRGGLGLHTGGGPASGACVVVGRGQLAHPASLDPANRAGHAQAACPALGEGGGEVDKRIRARLHRQGRLVGDNPLQLTAVISQAAPERCAREESVAAEQLAQLQERAMWPNVELRVLPFDLGLHAGQDGPFTLLSFPDQLLPDAAYQEYAVGGHVIDSPAVVSQLNMLFGGPDVHRRSACRRVRLIEHENGPTR